MSQENVEMVRRAYADFNDGEMASVLKVFDPDVEFNVSDVFFDAPATYSGHDGFTRGFLSDMMELFETFRAEPKVLVDAGDKVVAVVQAGGIGRRSGAEVVARVGHVLTVRNRRVVRLDEYLEVAEAFEAVGLRE